jgi:hypothetical protein
MALVYSLLSTLILLLLLKLLNNSHELTADGNKKFFKAWKSISHNVRGAFVIPLCLLGSAILFNYQGISLLAAIAFCVVFVVLIIGSIND